MMRASVFGISPLLLVAAALVALAVLFVQDARPASADHENTIVVWSATLTQPTIPDPPYLGCRNTSTGLECSSTSVLTEDAFTYDGVDYVITQVGVGNSVVSVTFNKAIPPAFQSGATLWIQGRAYIFAEASISDQGKSAGWANLASLSWEADDEVRMSLEAPRPAIWSATLNVKTIAGDLGCNDFDPTDALRCTNVLSDDDFVYDGVTYGIDLINLSANNFTFDLSEGVSPLGQAELTLHVGSTQLRIADAFIGTDQIRWASPGLSWNSGDTVSLSLTTGPPATGVDLSTETLAVTEGSSGSATFTVALSADPGYDLTVNLVKTQYNQPGSGQPGHRWKSAAASLSPAPLTFTHGTSGNWGTAQTVTVTGEEDADSRCEQMVILLTTPARGNRIVNVGSGNGGYRRESDGTFTWVGSGNGSYGYRFGDLEGTHEPIGGSGNSITGVFVTVADDEAASCGTQGADGGEPRPTAVALALGEGDDAADSMTVDEKAGQVTLTATLDAPAPYSGIILELHASPDDTATRDADYTMPDTIAIPAGERFGSVTITVIDDALDEDDERANIVALATLLDGDLTGIAALTITDDDTAGQQRTPQAKYADLITKMKQWRDDPCCASNKAHTDRWDRALLTFGETVADTTLSPMTATEAQGYADRGWNRWVEVAQALRELENRAPTVSSAIGDATIVNESGTHQVSLSGVFSDADNDSLTVTATPSDEAVASVSVASDHTTLTVTAKSRGTATITVTASDGRGGTVSDTFAVKVKAAPVVASAISDISGLEVFAAQEISLDGVFSDADGDSLTLSAASSDEDVVNAALFDDALTVFGMEEGTATITVTAQDADGNTVSDSFDVTVGPPTPVANLSCVAETKRVAFLWDAPEWSGGKVYAYDYELTLPGGRSESGRLIGGTLLLRTGQYQANAEASISVTTVYELSDGSNVTSAEATLTCTVA